MRTDERPLLELSIAMMILALLKLALWALCYAMMWLVHIAYADNMSWTEIERGFTQTCCEKFWRSQTILSHFV